MHIRQISGIGGTEGRSENIEGPVKKSQDAV